MVFGFGKDKKKSQRPQRQTQDDDYEDDHDDYDDEEEGESILFQGAMNDKEVNLAANARLAEAALIPAKELVTDAILRRAEALRLDPKGDRAVVTFMIDGVPYSGGRMSWRRGNAIVQMLKLLAGLEIRERQKPQSGGVRSELDKTKYELRVTTTPVTGGVERLTVQARNVSRDLATAEELGFTETLKMKIRELSTNQEGAVLVCGPPNSGTTSSLIGVLRSIDAYLYTIYTIADTQGRELPHISQFQLEPGDNLQESLNRCIRAEANVIHVDPIRDAETAKVIFSTQKRVCLVAEFTARDAPHGIVQLTEWLEDPSVVAAGLKGVLSQTLIRLLCDRCKRAFRPNPKMMVKVGLPPETKVLYRPTIAGQSDAADEDVCQACGGIGYRGRIAIFELIEMTDGMREFVLKQPSPQDMKSQARQEKMISKQAEGLRLVAEGRTSLEELQRVFKSR